MEVSARAVFLFLSLRLCPVYDFKVLKHHRHILGEFVSQRLAVLGKEPSVSALPGLKRVILPFAGAEFERNLAKRQNRYGGCFNYAVRNPCPVGYNRKTAGLGQSHLFRCEGMQAARGRSLLSRENERKQAVCRVLVQVEMKALEIARIWIASSFRQKLSPK